ncbi:MAG TPA: LacI family DNA-binding transcriptional regulator [Candidatus Limnocylindrales bacterium]|nr:LacI family DNA-binding transcriptional regulator [Candidatus Limnocylindrales bacterium]
MEQVGRRVTIADVAEKAGVSKTAVSFAFNNPDRLNTATASRILDIAHTLGYRPDPVARMLTQRRTGSIGVLTPQDLSVVFTNPFFGTFSAGIAGVAEEHGYGLHFISPLHGSLSRAIHRATVDGVVAIGLTDDHPEIDEIRRAGLPMVLVDSDTTGELASVDVDDEAGASLAASHLLDLGHRDIAILAIEGPRDTRRGEGNVVGRRIRGYRTALEAAGINIPSDDIEVGPATIRGGRQAFRRLWAAGRRPTGVLAMSDAMAIGAIAELHDLGVSIPGAVSVVGFDDVELAESTNPPLTTVHQPVRGKGETAVRLLLAVIEGRDASPGHRRLETRLVVRSSTGPVAADRREVTAG